MSQIDLNHSLIDFITESPTPFHAVDTLVRHLSEAGFIELDESKEWQLQPGNHYYVTRNNSSIIAFKYADKPLISEGIRMIGAHTDSPCLKVKPNADIHQQGYLQVGVEVYGGVLLNPWFDRELSLAGKVSVLDERGELSHKLIDFKRPIGMIPSLAIHLDREVNKKRSINAQTDLPVVLQTQDSQQPESMKSLLLHELKQTYPSSRLTSVLDYELSFYDAQPGCVYGMKNDFIAASRLDNLLSCYISMRALIEDTGGQHGLFVFNDHEEVGSQSAVGAGGPMLENFLQRLCDNTQSYIRMMRQSMMLSVDNAHGIHPNYASRHDGNHGPMINQGPVMKVNANQRYASNTETQSMFRSLCNKNNIPVQTFVVRSDMGCGSTIGPIAATELGVKTLDIGIPTWAMHSIRETAGSKDTGYLLAAIKAYLRDSVGV